MLAQALRKWGGRESKRHVKSWRGGKTERSIQLQIPYDFLKFYFSYFTPFVRLIIVEKGHLNFRGFKNVMEREIRKILTFVKRSVAFKIFGKITLEPS